MKKKDTGKIQKNDFSKAGLDLKTSDFASALIDNTSDAITAINLKGEPVSLIESERHSDPFFKDLWRTIKKGQIWRGILCKRSCAGNSIYLETTIKPVHNIDGDIRKYVAMYVEITYDRSIRSNRINMEYRQNIKIKANHVFCV